MAFYRVTIAPANFRKHAERLDLLRAGVEINRGCTRRTRAAEIETEPGTYVDGAAAVPNDIHQLFILTSSSATVPYRRLLEVTSSDALVHS